MIKDFDLEVKSQLDSDEKIENSFTVKNESMIDRSVDMSVASGAFLNGEDYSFSYKFIITNKRVFIGSVNSFRDVISYEVYNRNDIKISNDKRKKKKISARILYQIAAIYPIVLVAIGLFNFNLKKNNIIVCALLVIGIIMLFFLLKQLNKISDKLKLTATVCLKNNKKLYGIFNSENEISILKNL